MELLYTLVILLFAAVIAVPIAKRLGFGSVLGYLAAGLVIGPAGLRLITDVENIAHVSELGVVMLLFLIGLELRPARIWVMRRSVLGLGAAQVFVTTGALAAALYLAGFSGTLSAVAGFCLALSSTAIVLPMLGERALLTSHAGRDGFSVLLFQDMAVIPAVALIPVLGNGVGETPPGDLWLAVAKGLAALAVVLVGGRYLIRPLFRVVDRAKTPEIFTAATLAIVIGTAALVSAVGLSMSLGAFIAGVLLSDSEYRHELRADIEPFEGLLLGIFFISVGMSANLGLFATQANFVISAVVLLLLVKGTIAFCLAKLAGQGAQDATRFAFALPQAGEFGFVLFAVAVTAGIMNTAQSELFMLVITISMIVSPLLFWAEEKWLAPVFDAATARPFDDITESNEIVICGFGRMGQVIGRILRLRRISFTALDKDAEQVALVRRFGAPAFYGDATRLDLLRAAGAGDAKILVVALDDIAASLTIVEHAKRYFPQAKILARARNRRHVHLLRDREVEIVVRETFHSSLKLSEEVMLAAGMKRQEVLRTIALFAEQDEKMMVDQHPFYQDQKRLIQTAKQVSEELERLLDADQLESPAA